MKRIIFLILFTTISSTIALSCPICGCSAGNYFIGPFPQFRKHFVGMRYTFRKFETRLADEPDEFSHDFYQTAELWGGFNVGSRWQVVGFLPYSFNDQKSDEGRVRDSGLGDITLLLNYKLWSHNSAALAHTLWIGGGAKVPTGKYSLDPNDPIPSANRQPGTGSLDFIANAMYSLQYGKWGVSSNVNYKMNQSADHFRFGNRLSAGAFFYRQIKAGSATISPTAGLLFEKLDENHHDHSDIPDTGGHSWLGAVGLETNLKIVTIGFNAQLPVSQDFSNGQTVTKIRGMFHVTHTF